MSRRGIALLFSAIIAVVTFAPPASVHAASGDKELSRVRGDVGYELTDKGPVNPIFGRADLPDNAFAVTQQKALALLRLRDSSEIEIGERTVVRVGEFNAVETGKDNEIYLDHGALHFRVRHPQGARSNYTFQTPTSQIAVRGSEGYIIQGSTGTVLICIECAVGDVLLRVGAQLVPVLTSQTATIVGTSPANATFTINPGFPHFPGVVQFNPGMVVSAVDPTGYLGVAAAQSAATGTLLTTLGVLGGVGATVVAANATTGNTPTPGPPVPTPTPTPTSAPTATPTSAPTATPTSAPTATPTVAPTATPSSAPTPTPTPTGTGAPTPTPSPTASPVVTPTPSPTATPSPGALNVSPQTLSFDGVPSTQSFNVSQPSGGGTISIGQPNCGQTGAQASDSPNSAPANGSTTSISVTAQAAPTQSPPPQYACTITVTGVGNQTATVYLNIRQTNVGVSSQNRGPSPGPSPLPGPPLGASVPGTPGATGPPTPSPAPAPPPKPAPPPVTRPHG